MQVSTLTLGDTLNYTTSVPDYSAANGWVLKTRLVPRSTGSAVSLVSTADSTDPSLHRTSQTAAQTAAWTAGVYSWFAYVEKGSEQYKVGEGTITLNPNPRTASTLDNRSDAQIALDYVTTALSGKANGAVMSYRIGDRELRSYPMVELIALQTQLQTAVKREKRAVLLSKGMADPSKVYVRVARA
jgi:hypothetical protein